MRFKTDRVRAEWFGADLNGARITGTMKELALDAIVFAESMGWDPMLTCVLRTSVENDILYGGHGDHTSGVHVVGRGVDLRTHSVDLSSISAVVARINGDWIYDPTRPAMRCALFEGDAPGAGSSASHLHLQVHPATVERTFG